MTLVWWFTIVHAQQPSTSAQEGVLEVVGVDQVLVGEEWVGTAAGCAGALTWTVDEETVTSSAGPELSISWGDRGARTVAARCDDGRQASKVVVAVDGEPFVEVAGIINEDGALIGFADRLGVDAAYGDAPDHSTLRMVIYRGLSPVTGGGRSEVIEQSAGIARVDGYCSTTGPVHYIEIILEDMTSTERYAGSGRIKVRNHKFRCVEG